MQDMYMRPPVPSMAGASVSFDPQQHQQQQHHQQQQQYDNNQSVDYNQHQQFDQQHQQQHVNGTNDQQQHQQPQYHHQLSPQQQLQFNPNQNYMNNLQTQFNTMSLQPPTSKASMLPTPSSSLNNPLQPPPSSINNPLQPPPSSSINNPLQPPPQFRSPTNLPQPPKMPGLNQPANPLQPPPSSSSMMTNPLMQPPNTINQLQSPPQSLNQPLMQPPSTTTTTTSGFNPLMPPRMGQPPTMPGSTNQQLPPTFPQPPTNFAQNRYPQPLSSTTAPAPSMMPPPTLSSSQQYQQPPTLPGAASSPYTYGTLPGQRLPTPPGQPLSQFNQPYQQQQQQPPQLGVPPQQPQLQQQPQSQQQQQQQNRIDPDAMPNPIDVMNANSAKSSGLFRTNDAGILPPLVTTEFTCKDEGNCNPRFVRSTLYSIPSNQDLIKQSRLPIALAITPFAKLKTESSSQISSLNGENNNNNSEPTIEYEPPISNLGELGPVRCKRCKAYMSPYMQFIDNGRRFQCPYCEDVTPVPQEYFNHLDHMGKRVDRYERPELCFGSYEFIATKDYCRNQQLPNAPAFIFMIDVSVNSIRSGLLKLICSHIKTNILPNLPKEQFVFNGGEQQQNGDESLIRVGFITYDKELHFYNLKSTLAAPQMMIVSDIDEIFVPILDGFLVKPSESESVIDCLLEQLPTMFNDNKEADLLLGPVIEAGIEALQSAKCAGKLFIFHSNIPSAPAPGQLKNRDDRKLLGTDREKQILSPASDYYSQLGKKCVDVGCSINLFLTANQYCDVASIAECIRKSSGQIYKYDFFMSDTHGERLIEDFKYSIKNTIAFDAVMKVRTSTGIKAFDYLGNFNQQTNDVELASCDKHQTIDVELKHEDKLNENSKVYIQVAVLYTSISGQRRIRIHNLNLNICSQYSSLYPCCELDTIINYIAKLACRSVLQSTPKSIQENIIQQIAHILACYRKNCANAPSRGQFILPETLKLIPLFVNSLLKSEAISGAKTVTTDERAWLMYRLMSMDVQSTYVYFYPRLIPLLDVEDVNNLPQIRCSYERLKDDSLYLLENGIVMYLWIGSNVSPTVLQSLFGTPQIQQINIEKSKLSDIDTPLSKTVRSVINKVNEQRSSMLRLVIVRQKDTLEQFFRPYLVEDKNTHSGAPSYVDFLFQLHHEIKTILN